MNEDTLAIIKDLITFVTRMVNERNEAMSNLAQVTRDRDDSYEALRIVAKERDALREKVRSLTDLLADAEAKIEGFNAALDTEARR